LFGTISLVFQGRHTCCTNWITSNIVSFYHMGTSVHINYICQLGKWSPILFSHWLTCLHKVCFIKWKGLEMVDKMCDIFCLKHGKVNKNTVVDRLLWDNQHFLFLFGDKHLATQKNIFPEIEMDFWMYIWRHTFLMERLIFLCFHICGLADKQRIKH
jgi:hypothetical protein